jgi:hypothetical protein
MARQLTSGFDRLQKVDVSVTESTATVKKRCSITFIEQSQLISLKPLKMVLCSSRDGVPLKFNIKKTAGPPV